MTPPTTPTIAETADVAPVPTVLPYATAEVAKQPPLGHRAAQGLAWMMMGTVGTKLVGFAGQVILSYLLFKEDFGLLAKCFAVATIPSLLAQIGLRQVLVRRAKRFDRWVGPAVWLAAAFGLGAAVLMVAIAPLSVEFFDRGSSLAPASSQSERALIVLILLTAASVPPGLVAETLSARLQSQLRFRTLSLIAFGTVASVMVLTVAFAAMGFGAYSFGLPSPIVGFARLAFVWWLVRPPVTRRPHVRRWKYLIGDSSVVLASRAAATVVVVGDYLLIARYHPDDVVGLYYFAFTLSTQALMLVAANLEGVLFPALSQLQDEPARQRQAFLSATRLLALAGVFLCVLQAGLAGPGVRAVLAPKWHPIVAALQMLSLGMALRVASLPSQSLMQAQGRFKVYMWANVVGGAVFLAAVYVAARYGGDALTRVAGAWPAVGRWLGPDPRATPAVAVAIAVALYLAAEGPVMVYLAVRPAGGRWHDVARVFAAPVALSAVAVGAAYLVAKLLGDALPLGGRAADAVRIAVIGAVGGGAYLALVRFAVPDAWAEGVQRLAAFRRRKSTAAA